MGHFYILINIPATIVVYIYTYIIVIFIIRYIYIIKKNIKAITENLKTKIYVRI